MGKVQRRAKGGDGERKQRRHTAMPRLNRTQRKFKRTQQQQKQQPPPTAEQPQHNQHYGERTTPAAGGDDGKNAATAKNGGAGGGGEKNVYLSAYKRAQRTYERLQAEKRVERERAREERERVEAKRALQTRWRRKKNQALQLRTAKGQPNLNAQIGILLEQIERKVQQ